jgi:hypothetical protein
MAGFEVTTEGLKGVFMNFHHDLAEILRSELAAHGYDEASLTSDESIVRGYLSVLHRSIPTKVRSVLESSEFACPASLAAGYSEVKRKAISGESLIPHQSRRLDDAEYNDPMLNDWGVHHLHLGTSIEPHGYVTRTGPLLFARVTDTGLYAIQIFTHGAWSRQEIVKILHQNWPQSIEQYRLKGVIGLGVQYSDQQVQDFRKAGVQELIEIDGAIYAPFGGGITTSSESVRVIQSRNDLMRECRQLEGLTLGIAQEEASRGRPLPSQEFRLTRQGDKAIVIEGSSNLQLCCANWLINQNLE